MWCRSRPSSSCYTTRTSSTTRTYSSSGTRRSRRRSSAARCARRRPPSLRGSRRRTTSRRRSRTDAPPHGKLRPSTVHVPWAVLDVSWTCPGTRATPPAESGWPWPAGWLEVPGAAADAPPSLRPARVRRGPLSRMPAAATPITRFGRRSCRAYEVGAQRASRGCRGRILLCLRHCKHWMTI